MLETNPLIENLMTLVAKLEKHGLAKEASELAFVAGQLQGQLHELQLGPTGRFPDGKLREDDCGETRLALGEYNKHVCIEFGVYTKWLALDPATAMTLGSEIVKLAQDISGQTGQPSGDDS